MKRQLAIAFAAAAALTAGCQSVETTKAGVVGVERQQRMMVSSEEVQQGSQQAYAQMMGQAKQKGVLDQDAATLKKVAVRLRGVYHDGNQKHIPSDLLREVTALEAESAFKRLTRREYALIALGTGSIVLAGLPWALYFFGTSFRPGRQPEPVESRVGRQSPVPAR